MLNCISCMASMCCYLLHYQDLIFTTAVMARMSNCNTKTYFLSVNKYQKFHTIQKWFQITNRLVHAVTLPLAISGIST